MSEARRLLKIFNEYGEPLEREFTQQMRNRNMFNSAVILELRNSGHMPIDGYEEDDFSLAERIIVNKKIGSGTWFDVLQTKPGSYVIAYTPEGEEKARWKAFNGELIIVGPDEYRESPLDYD